MAGFRLAKLYEVDVARKPEATYRTTNVGGSACLLRNTARERGEPSTDSCNKEDYTEGIA